MEEMRDDTYFLVEVLKRNEIGELEWELIAGDQLGVPARFADREAANAELARVLEFYVEARVVVEVIEHDEVQRTWTAHDEPQFRLVD